MASTHPFRFLLKAIGFARRWTEVERPAVTPEDEVLILRFEGNHRRATISLHNTGSTPLVTVVVDAYIGGRWARVYLDSNGRCESNGIVRPDDPALEGVLEALEA